MSWFAIYDQMSVKELDSLSRPSSPVPMHQFDQWVSGLIAEQVEDARICWTDKRITELEEMLIDDRASITVINPCWAVAPMGEKVTVWEDFAQWIVETRTNPNDDFITCMRRKSGNHIRVYSDYATARAEWECGRLNDAYFVEGA